MSYYCYDKEKLTETVKAIGNTIINNADDIANMAEKQIDLIISAKITVDSIPTIEVIKSLYPDPIIIPVKKVSDGQEETQ